MNVMARMLGATRLNLVAALVAAIGALHVYLVWRLWGLSSWADAWLTALVVVQSVALLAQAGVEQCGVHAQRVEAGNPSGEIGREFRRACLTWALLVGLAGAAVIVLLGGGLAVVFAVQLQGDAVSQLRQLLPAFALQVLTAPVLYVLRQQLMIAGRFVAATLMPALTSVPLVLALLGAGHWGWSPVTMAWCSSLGAVAGCLVVCLSWGAGLGFSPATRALLWQMIVQSAQMRAAHSMHHFLVTALLGSLLSGLGEGSLALYQYLKRLADGMMAVLLGPGMGVYGVAQNKALIAKARDAVLCLQREYLRRVVWLALPCVMLVLIWLGASVVLDGWGQPATAALLLLLVLWQIVIAYEYAAVACLIAQDEVGQILAINALYLLLCAVAGWMLMSRWPSVLAVAAVALSCQMVSLGFYFAASRRIIERTTRHGPA
jgi:hypothetical protein